MRTICVLFVLVAGFSVSGSAAELTGYISDESCATSGASASKATDWIKPDRFESCVKKCVKEGSKMIFLTEDNKILKFDASSSAKAVAHMGRRVKVTGTATDGVLKVDAIAAIEMQK
jgi:hypothetical protein